MSCDIKKLQYLKYTSSINPSFWHKMTELKLDVDKLCETERDIWGYMTVLKTTTDLAVVEVDYTSFNIQHENQQTYLPLHGKIYNKNTKEQFKDLDKTELINNFGAELWNKIKSGAVLDDLTILNTFLILSFADLKKYQYFYWFAFPALTNLCLESLDEKPQLITDLFTDDAIVSDLCKKYIDVKDVKDKAFFLVTFCDKVATIFDYKTVINLAETKQNFRTDFDEYYFAFSDPACDSNSPGWPLRNYALFLLYFCPSLQGKQIKFLGFRLQRDKTGVNCKNSIIVNVKLPENVEKLFVTKNAEIKEQLWIGWEKNLKGNFGPRLSDMGPSMDPIRLAETSVDLNLKLMKWRLLPNIDLDKIKTTKYLLLGAGTLGCSVARTLLGWGAKNITFVDNGRVSFTNPVRQSLFTHADCLNGGKAKAIAAADNLKNIFPSVNAVGYQFNIPMPGHPVGESLLEECKDNVLSMDRLVLEHDVVFLLTDTRESRWLPTLLGAYYRKIVINAALGFDTYLVMRHGFNSPTEDAPAQFIKTHSHGSIRSIQGDRLGCYFCNDVTAPGNSLKDRTLDQQCTVTRPGISAIAGSLAVELAVSILQHEDGRNASAFYNVTNAEDTEHDETYLDQCLLGIVPHSIRGFLSDFTQVIPATHKYAQCVACSKPIMQEYRTKGFDFLLEVFNSSKCLEKVTGLADIYAVVFEDVFDWNNSDDDDDDLE